MERRGQAKIIPIDNSPISKKNFETSEVSEGSSEKTRPSKDKFETVAKIIHRSDAMRELLKRTIRLSGYLDLLPLLITGETGTGKSLFANMAYETSQKKGSLISVNCGGYNGDPNIMNSEFFGHRKGSFTGAVTNKRGFFEVAKGGVIFLDEIGELPLVIQTQLLSVLDDGTYRGMGEIKNSQTDACIIAATNKDLEKEVEERRFRADLFHRLNGARIKIPPLRERPEDIPLLAKHFIEKFHSENGNRSPVSVDFSPKAMSFMENYSWPGNVRELANTIRRAYALCAGEKILIEHLGLEIGTKPHITAIKKTNEYVGSNAMEKVVTGKTSSNHNSHSKIENKFLELDGAKEFKENFPAIVMGESTWNYVINYARIALAILTLKNAKGKIGAVNGDTSTFLKKLKRIKRSTGVDIKESWEDDSLPSIPEKYQSKSLGEINQEVIGGYLKLVYLYCLGDREKVTSMLNIKVDRFYQLMAKYKVSKSIVPEKDSQVIQEETELVLLKDSSSSKKEELGPMQLKKETPIPSEKVDSQVIDEISNDSDSSLFLSDALGLILQIDQIKRNLGNKCNPDNETEMNLANLEEKATGFKKDLFQVILEQVKILSKIV